MYQQGTKSKCKVIALANQKGGTAYEKLHIMQSRR